jgi:hypothetical protein
MVLFMLVFKFLERIWEDRGLNIMVANIPRNESDLNFKNAILICRGWMIGGLSPGRGWEFFSSVKRPRREADHSLPSSAEVKNA